MDKMLGLFSKINELELVQRYDLYPEFRENTAAHTFKVVMYVDYLYKYLKLDHLDYKKCIELAIYHDFGEMGELADIDAHKSSTDEKARKTKQEKEQSKISELSVNYGSYIGDLFREYEDKSSEEAIFVNVCDKIDGCLYVIWQAEDYIPNHEWFATYADKAMLKFPPIWPIYEEIKKLIKGKYLQLGYDWKPEYDSWLDERESIKRIKEKD